MKLIKLGLISFLVLGIIITSIGLLFPSTVLVSRAVDVNASIVKIKPMLADMHQWPLWLEGMKDSSVTIQSSTSAQIGNTAVTITAVTDSTIVANWQAADGALQVSTMRLIGKPEANTAIVQWQFVQQIGWYPWERFGSMMNDKIMGTQMERHLQLLKQVAEN
ncbi:hypothetical protein [Sediminibacterium sp.]|uniref:hypothetical protein n=1 Tax=Sediminibacterium sp. TaxID=1917865 RepID=UPI003F6993E8